MVAEGLGRRPAPKARAEGALENVGLLDPDFTGTVRINSQWLLAVACNFWHPGQRQGREAVVGSGWRSHRKHRQDDGRGDES